MILKCVDKCVEKMGYKFLFFYLEKESGRIYNDRSQFCKFFYYNFANNYPHTC